MQGDSLLWDLQIPSTTCGLIYSRQTDSVWNKFELQDAKYSTSTPAHEALVKVICRITAESLPAIHARNSGLLLRRLNLLLQRGRTNINALQLLQVAIEHAHDMRELSSRVSNGPSTNEER